MRRVEPGQERMARAVLLTVLYVAPALICLHGAMIGDIDLWWHLRAGEWIARHRGFPHTDPFSRYGIESGRPWAAYSWIFELVLLKLFERWDLVGVVAYSTGMVLTITVAVHRLLARLESDLTKAVLLTMAVMICVSPMFTPRPWLFTILFFSLEMNVLVSARRSGRTAGLLWLPLIFALWANIHIQFVDGLVVLGVAAVEATVERWRLTGETRLRARAVWLVLCGCVVATLVNPYGWGIYRVAYELASQRGVMRYVTELQAIPFRGFHDFLLLFLALGAAGMLAWGRRLPLFKTTLLGMAAVISFRSRRDVWFMAIVAGVVLASGWEERVDDGEPAERGMALVFPVFAACLLVLVGGAAMKVSNAGLRASLATQMPVRAVTVVKERGYRGVLYNTYNWGGYLMWTLREPVSLDGRAALHGDKRIERAMATWAAEPGWATDPEFAAASVVIAPVKQPLTQVLRLEPGFELVYEDAVAAVFLRRGVRSGSLPDGVAATNAASWK